MPAPTAQPEARGLTHDQARRLLAQFGPNEFRPPKKRRWLKRLAGALSEPTLLVLLAVLLIYLAVGSHGEAGLLSGFVLLVLAITFIEETRTEEAVESLRSFASPRAVVLREGQWTRVLGLDVVPGDCMRLQEGDRIAADAELMEAHDLTVDESALTGESAAVWKTVPGEVSAGTLVLQGQAVARVQATGIRTRLGAISKALVEIKAERTPFQRSAAQLVRVLAWAAAASCLLVAALSLNAGQPLVPSILNSLTLAMATVPEEMPVVLIVFLALGARRLSRQGVLAQRIPAVETLGAITVLAVDKTGTLTLNDMRLKEVWEVPGPSRGLLACAALACEPDSLDPMEREILARSGAPQGSLVHEYSLSGRPPRMGHVWDGGRLAVKGAVEGVLEHCRLAEARRTEILQKSLELARQGLRVLGVAGGSLDPSAAPSADIPAGLEFLGLLGFEDPLRPGVPEALVECRRAGIEVVMMTGDSRETALAVASRLGIPGPAVLGNELEAQPGRVEEWARTVRVFARLAPEQKQILVQAWSRQGQVVGMTGDGVNDAPALAQAQVGVAMGLRGTDVARETASLVLTDDSFISLVAGIRTGRQTTDRILKAARFILAVHIPIVGAVLGCLFLGLPPLITAAQVAFLELFIGPACSVVFEKSPADGEVMGRPPRSPQAPLLDLKRAWLPALQGLVLLAVVLGWYRRELSLGLSDLQARASAFWILLAADCFLCWTLLSAQPFWHRERWSNLSFWLVSAGVGGLLLTLTEYPPLAELFRMSPLDAAQIGRSLGVAAAASLWVEPVKVWKGLLWDGT
jgi:Ca2+-transporting ATPase